MSLNRDQYAVVLAALRERLRSGEWIEGGPLTVADIADACGVSATPVREALSRLAGEGLIDDRRGRGFEARRVDAVDLADLYRSQLAVAIMADGAAPWSGMPDHGRALTPDDFLADPVRAWEAVFDLLLRRARASFFLCEQRRLADRLAPARRVEATVLNETAVDFEPLIEALALDAPNDLRAALERLHHRRMTHLEGIVAAMRLEASQHKSRI